MIHEKKFFRYALYTIMVLIIVLLLGQVDFLLKPIFRILTFVIVPFVLSSIFYYLFRPVVRKLEEKKIPRIVTILGLYLFVVALLVGLSIYAGHFFRNEFDTFADTFAKGISVLESDNDNFLNREFMGVVPMEELQQQVRPILESSGTLMAGRFSDAVSTVITVFLIIFMVPLVLFFLLKDEEIFHQQILRWIPGKHKDRIGLMLKDIDTTFMKYIIGQFIIGFLMGLSTFIAYLIIGLPNPLILGIFVMITSFIPFLGPVLGLFPALLIAITIDLWMVVKVLIIFVVIEVSESNLFRPNVMGQTLHMHPLMVVFSVFVATYIFGVLGTFLAVPVYVAGREVGKRLNDSRGTISKEVER